ncbi:DUF1672 family protein [Staphylococcus aureus]|uniref:DUF1672 family protein n=1 Tax=Staphylococcus aureus TaxID=1280 RepID=UPI0002CC0327|nr:DUF1672 family protein [Staphylococcus aureus]ENM20367.1 hypothetical protein U5O_01198 [Staphylococcus aureus M1093]
MFKRTKLILIATILLSGCSTTNNESNNETKSVPEEMEASKYVGQGFQPPAEKDAIEFAKKHQYTGFTKEAINKTQNSGYENEYFYIVANIPTLQEYRKYYEPLIKKNNLNFKKGMKQARKGVGYKAAIEVHTTLFSRSSNFSKDKKLDDVLDLSESTKKLHLNFENTKIFLQLAKSTISTNRVNYSDNESIRIEVE